ncbi:MAG: hypothetical protein AAGN66_20515 [Acidobacteriota bacterium]
MDADKRRWILILTMLVLGSITANVAAKFQMGWQAACTAAVLLNVLVLAYLVRFRDGVIGRFYVLALIAGVCELLSDYWAVSLRGILVYPADEPHLWKSPAYMPLAWSATLVEFVFIASWLGEKIGRIKAALLLASVGAVFLPLNEYLAKFSGFWYYQDCWMLWGIVPVFLILAESVIVAVLPWFAHWAKSADWWTLAILGVLQGAWMYFVTEASWLVMGTPPT